jgi:hypothetical protein
MSQTGYVWMGNSGCLLPLLIIFNLFFGQMIFGSTRLWLGVEAVLVLIFILKIKLITSRISRQFRAGDFDGQGHKRQGKVVDIQGQVVEDNKKLK